MSTHPTERKHSGPKSITLDENTRQFFRLFNRFMLFMWRLGLGQYMNFLPELLGRYMVLTHIGRKSGHMHRTPVNYAIVNADIYCTAGFGPKTDWYRNILTHPNIEVWLPDGRWAGVAEDVSDHLDRLAILREVIVGSGFMSGILQLEPRTASDELFASKVESYRLVRIRRTAPMTGAGGPGDLSWVWPLSTMMLLWLYLRRRSNKK